MENEVKKSFTEVYIILNELNLYDKIPNELKVMIETDLDRNYIFTFNKEVPLFNQINNDITRNLLTYIYTNYIDKDNKYIESEIKSILNVKY